MERRQLSADHTARVHTLSMRRPHQSAVEEPLCGEEEGLGRGKSEIWKRQRSTPSLPSFFSPHSSRFLCTRWLPPLRSLPSSLSSVRPSSPISPWHDENRARRWSRELTCRPSFSPSLSSGAPVLLLYATYTLSSTYSRRARLPPSSPSLHRARSTPRTQPSSVGDGGTGKTTFVKRVRSITLFHTLLQLRLTRFSSFDST
jgi:hypothetical protein